jgi:hypothetical protein
MVQLPVEFLDWLDREGLVDEFDDQTSSTITGTSASLTAYMAAR